MQWQEILTILIPILGLMGWVYNRIEKKLEERFKEVRDQFKEVRDQFKEVKNDLKSIDQRLTRLEIRMEERGYREPQIRIIKDKNDIREK